MTLSVQAAEVEKFNARAQEWWSATGAFRLLHEINPLRLDYLKQQISQHFNLSLSPTKPYQGLSFLDVGCGGGLLCEPMARLGGRVMGIDAGAENIAAAQAHATGMGLAITYQTTTTEALAASSQQQFDVVCALEILEHTADYQLVINSCLQLLKPGGLLLLSTLNRTPKSYALAILGAEYLLRWVPHGTHNWHKFLKPSEIQAVLKKAGWRIHDLTGLTYALPACQWRLSDDLEVNYFLTAKRG